MLRMAYIGQMGMEDKCEAGSPSWRTSSHYDSECEDDTPDRKLLSFNSESAGLAGLEA